MVLFYLYKDVGKPTQKKIKFNLNKKEEIAMKKRFRDENGNLTCTLQELYNITRPEADKYFQVGWTYLNAADGEEYLFVECDEVLNYFKSFNGKHLFIPVETAGSFLPDVASEGMELFLTFRGFIQIEEFISVMKYFPEVIAIEKENVHDLFVRNNLYAGTCNELYENRFGYKFRCAYGKYNGNKEYRCIINGENFTL